MILYDYALSSDCYKVRLLLRMLDLSYETRRIDVYPGREHEGPAFRAVNPLAQVPVLETEGARLRDPQAILAYLARRHDPDGAWLPLEPAALGAVMMWLGFAGGAMAPLAAARLHDVMGAPVDIEAARAAGRRALRVLDDHLAERTLSGAVWLVGARPTIADLACFPDAALCGDGGVGCEDFPALRDWMRAVRRLPRFHSAPGVPEFA